MNEKYTITSSNPVPEIKGPRRQRIESIVSDVFSKEPVPPTLTEVSDQSGALELDLNGVSDEGRREFRKRIEKIMMGDDIAVSTESADGPLTPVASYRDEEVGEDSLTRAEDQSDSTQTEIKASAATTSI